MPRGCAGPSCPSAPPWSPVLCTGCSEPGDATRLEDRPHHVTAGGGGWASGLQGPFPDSGGSGHGAGPGGCGPGSQFFVLTPGLGHCSSLSVGKWCLPLPHPTPRIEGETVKYALSSVAI